MFLSLGLEIGSVFSIYFTTGCFEKNYLGLNLYVINGENDLPPECWISKGMLCAVVTAWPRSPTSETRAVSGLDGTAEVPFWPSATSMCSWIVFHDRPWAHRNWEATPLVLICGRGRKNVIYKCGGIVPPTQTWPPISRHFKIPRVPRTAFAEGNVPPGWATSFMGPSAKWKCRATCSKSMNFRRARAGPSSVWGPASPNRLHTPGPGPGVWLPSP